MIKPTKRFLVDFHQSLIRFSVNNKLGYSSFLRKGETKPER